MTRSPVRHLLDLLLLLATVAPSSSLYIDTSVSSPEFPYEEDSIITQINSYDEKYVAFLTDKHFSIYRFRDGTIKPVQNISHGIENVNDEHLATVMTHKYIAYITKDALYYFKLEDDRKNITEDGTQVFPSKYFRIPEFTSDLTLNSRTYLMLMKTGPREIHLLDFKDSLFPSSRKLMIPTINPTSNITHFKLVANADQIALLFTDHSVSIIDHTIKKDSKGNYVENPEITDPVKLKVPDGYQVENMAYDYHKNFLILVANYTKATTLQDRNTPRVVALLYSCHEKQHGYKSPIKTLDLKDMNLPADCLKNLTIRRTGTRIMIVNYNNSIFSYNMDADSAEGFLGRLELPESERAAGYRVNNTFTLSNWIQTSKCKVQDETDMVYFKYLKLLTRNRAFCHPTNENCVEPFVPSKKTMQVAMGFTGGTALLVVLLVVFIRGCTELEMLLSRSSKERRKRESLDDSAPEITSIG